MDCFLKINQKRWMMQDMLAQMEVSQKGQNLFEREMVTIEGPIYSDFMLEQDRLILNGVSLNIKLTQSSDSFRLMTSFAEKYKVKITEVSNEAYSGRYNLNPFNFLHSNVNYLEITVDGIPVPHRPFKPNFAANDYIPSYLSLMDSNCSIDKGVSITYSDYPNGYTIFIFDIQSYLNFNVMTKPKKGHVSLNLGFSEALDKTINVIVYAKFPDVMEIDQSRKVKLSSFASKSK